MTRKRLAVARLWFEGNAFGPVPAGMAQFEQYEWQAGPEVLDTMRGTATELGAVARFADQHPDWDVVVLRCAAALPAGPIDQVVMHRYMQELRDGLQAGTQDQRWDAVYLSLHGAAIAQQSETPELDVVRMVRQLLPDTPIGASFDLHGNMPADWADVLDIASVYRTHPHIDMDDTADRVLTGLRQMVDGKLRTHRVLLNEGIILPSINMRTVPGGPMYTLEQVARDATQWPVIEVALFGGFPYADTAATGASVFVLSDASGDPSGQAAHTAAQTVMTKVRELASEFQMSLPSADSAIQQALAINRPGLIAITDSGDNPLCGGGADTPGLFRAVIEAKLTAPTLFASFVSPEIVVAAQTAGLGSTIAVTLGARNGTHFGHGIDVEATVERLTDGVFLNSGPMQTGVERRCGPSVVLRIHHLPSLHVIVTERVVAADDPAFYALHGVEFDQLRLLCVKAKNHFRAAFATRCIEIIDCDSPGPACLDLSQLPFKNRHIPLSHTRE